MHISIFYLEPATLLKQFLPGFIFMLGLLISNLASLSRFFSSFFKLLGTRWHQITICAPMDLCRLESGYILNEAWDLYFFWNDASNVKMYFIRLQKCTLIEEYEPVTSKCTLWGLENVLYWSKMYFIKNVLYDSETRITRLYRANFGKYP